LSVGGFAIGQTPAPALTAPNNSAGEPSKPPEGAKPAVTAPAPEPTAAPPSRTESARTAFDKLDREKLGYVTLNDVVQLSGKANFDDADRNKDGKLSFAEFETLWNKYRTGN
jgi:hypothetical protein